MPWRLNVTYWGSRVPGTRPIPGYSPHMSELRPPDPRRPLRSPTGRLPRGDRRAPFRRPADRRRSGPALPDRLRRRADGAHHPPGRPARGSGFVRRAAPGGPEGGRHAARPAAATPRSSRSKRPTTLPRWSPTCSRPGSWPPATPPGSRSASRTDSGRCTCWRCRRSCPAASSSPRAPSCATCARSRTPTRHDSSPSPQPRRTAPWTRSRPGGWSAGPRRRSPARSAGG